MLHSYPGGGSDDSPFPEIFPDAALANADGTTADSLPRYHRDLWQGLERTSAEPRGEEEPR